jgi:hypothetical protein
MRVRLCYSSQLEHRFFKKPTSKFVQVDTWNRQLEHRNLCRLILGIGN